ncbi:recombinase family protein [Bradyrhizobium sp. NC92]|uniref:recombinase family protein n=1 Tax=Bradyrhizobium sp. (strain NC92) TaxID=55395 RepID=UPI0021A9EC8F|nr:recombinase family protein [Bradyrhizobium sp. NC92]UWU69142.1 recombinase family protein [Bradyrhizobium sp. NC92]
MDAQRQPKAYSYKRFSTPAQEQGDSLRRQTAMAQAWADRMGVPLDTQLNLIDRGVSALHGANRDVGNLGAFLRAVEDGTVPKGSWLLVENLDRLSREPVFEASFTMQSIIRAGVTVVDLSDNGGLGREYNKTTLNSQEGLMHMMAMLLSFARGNQESVQKGRRVGEAYANKRAVFASEQKITKPYTKRLPGWLRWSDETAAYELIEERAERLRWMFEMADEGVGAHSIAAQLNDAKEDTWGAGGWKAKYWHRSYVRKLLTNKAAIGVFVPHTVRKVEGKRTKERKPQEPILHRFPAAVDRELFERVTARLSTTEARGKNAKAPVRSIFAGLVKCQHCGGTVTRVNKGAHTYLVCAAAHAKAGTCKYESVPYDQSVRAFRTSLHRTLDSAPRGNDTTDIDAQIEQLRVEIDAGEDAVNELLELAIADKSSAARERLRRYEQELEDRRNDLRTALERRGVLMGTNVEKRLAAVEKALTAEPLDTEAANKALRGAVSKMIMRPQDGRLDILWHHADQPQETLFMTKRFDWDGQQIADQEQEDAE